MYALTQQVTRDESSHLKTVNGGSVFSLNQTRAHVKPEVIIYLGMLIRHLRTIFFITKH